MVERLEQCGSVTGTDVKETGVEPPVDRATLRRHVYPRSVVMLGKSVRRCL